MPVQTEPPATIRLASAEEAALVAISLRSQGIDARWLNEPSPSFFVAPVAPASAVVFFPAEQIERAREVLSELGREGPAVDWSQIGRAVVSEEFCVHCGYSFDGLNQPGRCPECGVANILDDRMAEQLDPGRRVRRRRGYRLVMLAMLALVSLLVVVVIASTIFNAVAS